MNYDAVINPVRGRNSPRLGQTAVMVAAENDCRALLAEIPGTKQEKPPLMMSRVCLVGGEGVETAIVGPMVGAPYAVILLENLIAWGAQKVLFFGWCGSLSPGVNTGDILLPTFAFIDEGTSPHYDGQRFQTVPADKAVLQAVRQSLMDERIPFHEGSVWTTDAVFRETPEKVRDFQGRGALGVEMETSALFTVGRFRGIAVGAVLVVSDELASLKWRAGFKNVRFQESRRKVRKTLPRMCELLLKGPHDATD